MAYNKKTIPIKKDEFAQLNIYIQQVREAAKIVQAKHKHKTKLSDFINIVVIHSSVLEKYFNSLVSKYDIKDLPNLGD